MFQENSPWFWYTVIIPSLLWREICRTQWLNKSNTAYIYIIVTLFQVNLYNTYYSYVLNTSKYGCFCAQIHLYPNECMGFDNGNLWNPTDTDTKPWWDPWDWWGNFYRSMSDWFLWGISEGKSTMLPFFRPHGIISWKRLGVDQQKHIILERELVNSLSKGHQVCGTNDITGNV